MLKILQVRLQQYLNQELPDVQAWFRKDRGTRDQIANIPWITEKARGFQGHIYFCFTDCTKAFDCVVITHCGKFLRQWDYKTILPLSWETYMWVKKQENLTRNNWLVQNWERSWILSLCLFNFCAQYIMQNARLDELQTGIKIARRNINNLGCAGDTTLMVESKEWLKSLLMRGKEESEKAGLKLNTKNTKIMAFSPVTSWQIEGQKV